MLKTLLLIALAGLVTVVAVLITRTARFSKPQPDWTPMQAVDINAEMAAGRLAASLRFATVSYPDRAAMNREAFSSLRNFLKQSFPLAHSVLQVEEINQHSLLYHWPGNDPNLKPILLMAHQDVVPVAPGTEEDWRYPPFSGEVAEGFVWGRGALDVKSGLMGILEAVEALLGEGFAPQRSIYLAFGHDEEVGGQQGIARIVEHLKGRNTRFEFVIDEGGTILEGVLPDVQSPVALVGIAEKGYLSLELRVETEGGHSSMPPRQTAIGILSRAITRLEESSFPAHLEHVESMFRYLAPELPFLRRLVLANLWLFRPLVEQRMRQSREMNAAIRTSIAPTIIGGGVKENVLPQEASATVNFRIMPGETIQFVTEQVERIIDDPRVGIHPLPTQAEASSVSDVDSTSYALLTRTIRQVAGEEQVLVAPYLVTGGTDSRYLNELAENVYRFLFNRLDAQDLKRIHGTDERISVANYAQVIRFYYQLMKNTQ